MCGIVTIIKKDRSKANKMVAKRYEAQKDRGMQGYGYTALLPDGTIKPTIRTTGEREMLDKLGVEKSHAIMFHHRLPTSTANLKEATHPIYVSNAKLSYNWYVIHNGIISNADKLKKEHNQNGYEYTTEIRKEWITRSQTYYQIEYNDSEALAVDLAEKIEANAEAITAEGSIAFIAMQVDKATGKIIAIHYGRNYMSPLVLDSNKEYISLTSEGRGKDIEPNKLYTLNPYTYAIAERPFTLGREVKGYYNSSYDWGDYSYSRGGTMGFDTRTDKRMADLEDQIEDLELERDILKDELKEAVSRGDSDGEAKYKAEISEIEYQINKLEYEYLI